MGLLDDAIREHLDLKRRRGGDPAEIERMERDALGPVRREPLVSEHADPGDIAPAGVVEEPFEHGEEPLGALDEPPFGTHGEEPLRLGGEALPAHEEWDEDEFDLEPGPEPRRQEARRGGLPFFGRRRRAAQENEEPLERSAPAPADDLFGHDEAYADDEDLRHHAGLGDEEYEEDDEYEYEDEDDFDLEPNTLASQPGTVRFRPPGEEDIEPDDGDLAAPPPDAAPPPPPAPPPAGSAGTGGSESGRTRADDPVRDRWVNPLAPPTSSGPPSGGPPPPASSSPLAPTPPEPTGDEDDFGRTVEYDVEQELGTARRQPRREPAPEEPAAPGEPGTPNEDMLEETPDFLQDTPDHDRLWFEQRPPRDFDFDG